MGIVFTARPTDNERNVDNVAKWSWARFVRNFFFFYQSVKMVSLHFCRARLDNALNLSTGKGQENKKVCYSQTALEP